MGPEDKSREEIDRQLEVTGWVLQDKHQLNLGAGVGVAVRNFSLPSGPCDYLLFIDRKVAGVIEAKPEGVTLTGVSEQSERYMRELPGHLGRWATDRLVFGYESTGVETLFRDLRDPNSRSRNVFTFHRPEALLATLRQGTSFRGRLAQPAPLVTQGLRDCQIEALNGLDGSLAQGDPKALIQMIMGAGKTFTACTASYRFIKHAGAKRILFLVDRNNLGRQTLREFQDFTPPDDGRKFTQLYNVQHLQSNRIDPDAKVVITTIQRLYAMLRGQELSIEDEDASAFEGGGDGGSPRTVTYNPKLPIDTFDVIITDECHRSIYGVWRQVLEYFDSHIIGLTATPSRHTLGYFNRNLVSEYPYERSVADGVNVGYEVFRVRTHVTEQGATVDAGYQVPVRDRRTRRVTYEQLDQDLPYQGTDLDRSVTNPNQIRTVLETYKRHLFADLFPERTEVPKTLIFAKDDNHADEIVKIAAEPYREVPVRIRNGSVERRIFISGRPPDADLKRIVDVDLRPVVLPDVGLAISQMLAQILGVSVGDFVEVDLLEGQRRTVSVPVTALVEDYFGIRGMMDTSALARLMREAPAVNAVNVSLDVKDAHRFYSAVKAMPVVSGLALQEASLANFRKSVALLVATMASIYTALAAVIAFGVVYNSARVSLSERARELASLRVLWFTRAEVLRILLLELALLTLIAQPPGWLMGYGLAWIMKTNLAGELMRVRLVVENITYAVASTVVIAAALCSALIVRRRVDHLDLVAVLKTRD